MSTMIAEVYEAFKAAGVSDDKAKEAAMALSDTSKINQVEKDVVEIKGDIKLIKWMMGVIITMNIGILMFLFRITAK